MTKVFQIDLRSQLRRGHLIGRYGFPMTCIEPPDPGYVREGDKIFTPMFSQESFVYCCLFFSQCTRSKTVGINAPESTWFAGHIGRVLERELSREVYVSNLAVITAGLWCGLNYRTCGHRATFNVRAFPNHITKPLELHNYEI